MAEKKVYTTRPVEEAEVVEAEVEEEVEAPIEQPLESSQPTQAAPKKKGFGLSMIPTDRIIKNITDPEVRRATLSDKTMEPHIHLLKLLFIVFVLAIVISLIGL